MLDVFACTSVEVEAGKLIANRGRCTLTRPRRPIEAFRVWVVPDEIEELNVRFTIEWKELYVLQIERVGGFWSCKLFKSIDTDFTIKVGVLLSRQTIDDQPAH